MLKKSEKMTIVQKVVDGFQIFLQIQNRNEESFQGGAIHFL